MYAVVETGGKQYKVAKNDIVTVDLIDHKAGSGVKLNKILLVKEGNSIHVGAPYLKSSHVECDIVSHIRGDKVIAFKYKRRKSEKKKIGHRQELTKLLVKDIVVGK